MNPVTLFLVFILSRLVVCYNLDVSHPIIYEVPHDVGSYFGMSVAIRPKAADLGDTWTIQIGAPRGTVEGTGVPESGTVYRCHTYGPCKMFVVDEYLLPVGGQNEFAFREKKDGAWIGGSMDILSLDILERSVICGHRWINQNLKNDENIDVTYLMTGACYLQDLINGTLETPVQRLLPLVDKDKIYTPKPYMVDTSTYHWGLGQAGFSLKLTSEPAILLGAPGVTHWVGSVIKYWSNFEMGVGNFARTDIPRKNRYTYIGYSTTAGRFYQDREMWFVAGAPRSASYRGEGLDGIKIGSSLMGTTFGEYFGSAMAASDLNNDGFDDLIVGAPLFSTRDPDEGRVYVFLGSGKGNILLSSQTIDGKVIDARFGSCITAIGDLDQDGYNDVAVGAPYEDQTGAVYIFRGFAKGLHTDYSQRIRGQDIHPHLRGFGISISNPVDLDGNKYLDIAVGSYLSDQVILLRSRPVVELHPKIRTESFSLIDRKDLYFNITVCTMYTGSNAPEYVDVLRTLEIDPYHGKAALDPKTSPYKSVIRLRPNQLVCEIHTITLDDSNENYSPMQITLKTEINACSDQSGSSLVIKNQKTPVQDSFSKFCPTGNQEEVSAEIAFAGICGSDSICRSDLKLTCAVPEFLSGNYILGSSDRLTVMIKTENLGEPALHSRIKIWSNLKLKHENYKYERSATVTKKVFWFDLDGSSAEHFQGNYTFEIDLDGLKGLNKETQLDLMVQIFTSSLESDLRNNNCRFSVKLSTDVFVDFQSSSSPESLYISKQTFEDRIINVTHYYEVQKTGATPVSDAELIIYIPYHFDKEFLSFEVETAEWMPFSDYHEEIIFREDEVVTSRSNADVIIENCPPTNRTIFLNCSTPDVRCHILKIYFTGGIPTALSSYVKITMLLNVTAIDSMKTDKDIVYLSTSGVLKFWKFLEKSPKEINKSASISLFNEERTGEVGAHVIALSILAGGLLLSLIVTALLKGNFFKRNKREELKALKEADECFVYFTAGNEEQP